MKILLFSTTDENSNNLPRVLSKGITVADPAIMDTFRAGIAELVPVWNDCSFFFDDYAQGIRGTDISLDEVIDTFAFGKCPSLTVNVKCNCYAGFYSKHWVVDEI